MSALCLVTLRAPIGGGMLHVYRLAKTAGDVGFDGDVADVAAAIAVSGPR